MSRAPIDVTKPDSWPVIMRFEDVCAVLDIRPRTGHRIRAAGRFPVPEITPRIAGFARYSREDVLHAIKVRSGSATAAERRAAISRVR